MHRFLILIALLYSPAVLAGSFDVQFSKNTARLGYATEMTTTQSGPVDLEFGFLFNEDDDYMGTAGVMIRNDTLNTPVVLSVGSRFYYADAGNAPDKTNATVSAVTIGGELLFIPEALGGFGFGAYYFGAPSVVSFQDADGFTEYGLYVDYLITPNTSIYVGHETIKADLKGGGSVEIDDSAYIGIGVRF
jgi:hypothetical protein